ncbi:hypothetical protein TNCV_973661 [Trichonephila clavipes]|nr:hypothetical protein TNCV_973661 [Trichonephila clavipes]
MKNAAGRIKVDLSELYAIYWEVNSWYSRVLVTRNKSLLNSFSYWLNTAYRKLCFVRGKEAVQWVEDSSQQDSACSMDRLLC